MGLKPRMAAGTGIVADLKGALAGKTIALRADIDALPIQDEIETSYRSKTPGVCHACGHDGHVAMLLGAAKVLAELQDLVDQLIALVADLAFKIADGDFCPSTEATGRICFRYTESRMP